MSSLLNRKDCSAAVCVQNTSGIFEKVCRSMQRCCQACLDASEIKEKEKTLNITCCGRTFAARD